MAAGGDGVARQAELRWIEGNVCFKKVPSSMQEPPSHPKLPPRALMRAPPSTLPYMVQLRAVITFNLMPFSFAEIGAKCDL
ncbi:unnamed protein product [Miscanthus lutarioriparius]|uniref:Uncharacterized protein n=1 Tax=Miscanthus lutarioriparius TaxID=422564 RepID=A0A811SMY0_9POAL|nr:unnamed protein product [Miscanthus lutarioriparius]